VAPPTPDGVAPEPDATDYDTNDSGTQGRDTGTSDSTSLTPDAGTSDTGVPDIGKADAGADVTSVDSAPPHDASNPPDAVDELPPPPPPIAFVQIAAGNSTLQVQSVKATFAQAQTAGHFNVVAIGWFDSTSTVAAVTDSYGNTYKPAEATPARLGVDLSQQIYFAPNIAVTGNGKTTVTVDFVQNNAQSPDLRVLEYSGIDLSSPLDQTASNTGTSAGPASCGSVTTATARELLFAAGMTSDMYSGAGSGYTDRLISSSGDIVLDRIVSSTGSYSATAPLNKSSEWIMQMATFRGQ
jgi:hypothetical protein